MKQFNPSLNEQDDFEFKPLTEGLGFHKKSQDKEKSAAKNQIKFQSDMDLTINPPLPRKGFDSAQPLKRSALNDSSNNSTVDDILKTLNEKRGLEIAEKNKLHEPAPITFKKSQWDLSASLLDAMLITAASLLCLIILLVVTRVDLFANLYHPDTSNMVYWSLISLVAGITWIYLVGNRVFLGYTPGEWVFDQRLGKPEEFGTADYALKTIARSSLVLLTGLIIFPIISLFTNEDYLGKILGLELVRRS
jgi:hypothetical protein